MMNRSEIQKFFLLENDIELFETAIKPKSCGGSSEFEQLALFGDQVINIHLYNYLISKGWESSGDITKCKETIHKAPVIAAFADDFLGISDILTPLDSTYIPTENDLAETVEALIGAAFEVNGLKKCYNVISEFVVFAIKEQKKLRELAEFDKSQNYKGRLLELFKNPRLNTSGTHLNPCDLEPIRIDGTDNRPIFKFKGHITFNVIESIWEEYKSAKISKKDAKKRAMYYTGKMRYDNDVGYFWIMNTDRPFPLMLKHPAIPELEGTRLTEPKYNCVLGEGKNLSGAMVDICLKNGEGYIDYLWEKPTSKGLTKKQPKISHVKLFKPWNWIIGTGVYIDDIEKDVQDRIDAVIKDLNKTILKLKICENGYFFILSEKNYMLVHPNLAGKDVSNVINPTTGNKLVNDLKNTAKSSDPVVEYLWDKPGFNGDYRFLKKAYVTYYEPLRWYICSSVYKEDFEKKISNLTQKILLFSSFFLIIALIITLIVAKSITTPLNSLIVSMSRADKNGIPIDTVPVAGATEIKLLGITMNNMINSVSKSGKELKKQRDFSLGIINSSPDIICGLNHEGITTFFNPAGEQVTGYSKEEVIGKSWWELFPPTRRATK